MIKSSAEVLAITSGKGGVGKTTLTVNLGIAMSRQGKKVCLFDADTNLANINILLRETPEYTLQHVLSGEKSISEIIIHSNGISLIPGASGVVDFNGLDRPAQTHLLQAFSELEQNYDVILVDTSAGIHDNVLDFVEMAHQSIVLITPEPTSLTDAFSLLRMLRKRKYRKRINVVVNQAASEFDARKIFKRFSGAVSKYIGYHPAYLGFINRDELVSSAVCSQVPVRVYRPNAPSSRCFDRLSESLISLLVQQNEDKALTDVWRKYIADNMPGMLSESDSSPVPGATSNKVLSVNAEDKKRLLENKSSRSPSKYKEDDRNRKKQLLDDHKQALLEYIDDASFSKQDITLTLDRFMNTFFKRFKDYPGDLPEQINDLLHLNTLPQAQINQLLTVLMLFYKDNRIRIDRDFNAEFLNQQIDDYVNEYGKYPFDTTQALMQSVGLGQVSKEAILELDNVLNLVDKSKPAAKLNISEQVFVTNIEEDREDLATQIKDQIKETINPETANKSLKDSIQFASRLAE